MAEDKPPRKPREKKEVFIQFELDVEQSIPGMQYAVWADRIRCKNVTEAEKWLLVNCEDGKKYRLVTAHRTLTAKVEEVKAVKRSLT